MSIPQLVLGHLTPLQPVQLLGKAILIVDPDVRSLDWMQRVLSACGASVMSFCSVDNAICYLADGSKLPTIVISGPGMSRSEERQLIMSIRQQLGLSAHQLPAIAFSSAREMEGVRPYWLYMYQARLSACPSEIQILGATHRLITSHSVNSPLDSGIAGPA